MLTLATLLATERELATGTGDTYRRIMRPDALFVLPGMVLDAEGCARAMDVSPGWDGVALTEAQLLPVGADAAALVYTFEGRRGQEVYRATMASTYVEDDGEARLVLHQQTPLGAG
ncbi:DUF4440 domain-containing protein [Georgenia daeguensis]|uniref:DUF4440 domain-containing protein n=1 Tax=Georgenia daeguensis TaxID=908355 RepID=A0ABP8ENU2_9MICO